MQKSERESASETAHLEHMTKPPEANSCSGGAPGISPAERLNETLVIGTKGLKGALLPLFGHRKRK